jgi:hypothetical protein
LVIFGLAAPIAHRVISSPSGQPMVARSRGRTLEVSQAGDQFRQVAVYTVQRQMVAGLVKTGAQGRETTELGDHFRRL